MNIEKEKAAVINQLEKVDDLELILAVKHLLGFGLRQKENDAAFEAALARSLQQSDRAEGRPHSEVRKELIRRHLS